MLLLFCLARLLPKEHAFENRSSFGPTNAFDPVGKGGAGSCWRDCPVFVIWSLFTSTRRLFHYRSDEDPPCALTGMRNTSPHNPHCRSTPNTYTLWQHLPRNVCCRPLQRRWEPIAGSSLYARTRPTRIFRLKAAACHCDVQWQSLPSKPPTPQVKQIVGSTLSATGETTSTLETNFETTKSSADFAK